AAEKSSILPGIHVGISGEFYFGTSGENSRGIDTYPRETLGPLKRARKETTPFELFLNSPACPKKLKSTCVEARNPFKRKK
ncbi:hypothetical protein, partial [Rhizobium rhizogenes]|uniref:hypothetical protein n=1 Tax=Rhizobium rhizogenes TaxID=359 RepID=UPI001F2D741A